ncbi:RagB/SusD family nutrient uptake outer membrane protein [Belliella pelovolcani]|uniref:SusD family protein n=1 Tax=Belliella pelovolcani TaxID=529505 RepID=A0A1N7KEG8_9BACT|nr:RagB/SusD family nutrient uptake outer membrane protein [Belliella pelovolcani]SIS59864.1 SusD family protein [Belliella pelovolcani]
MKKTIYFLILAVMIAACDGFLDEKPLKSIVVPSTIEDFQSILDNSVTIFNNNPSIELFCTDDFEIPENTISGFNIFAQYAYQYRDDVFDGPSAPFDWARPYQQIYYTNVVLLESQKLTPQNQFDERRLKEIRAQAKFLRAFAYLNLVTLFAPVAILGNENNSPILPIFEEPIITDNPKIGTLSEINLLIENDLLGAIDDLPETVLYLTRPSKIAGYALLSRFYHYFGNYQESLKYSTLALENNGQLIDYNTLDLGRVNPFPIFMEEVLFFSYAGFNTGTVNNANFNISTSLLNLYKDGDLRSQAYFNTNPQGRLIMSGHYSGSNRFFGGVSLNEIYLNSAESKARANDLNGAYQDINDLLVKRYATGTYVPPTFTDQEQAIQFILSERRKELVGQNFLRWSDIKRLNHEGIYKIAIERIIEGQSISLPERDGGYFFKIPLSERTAMGLN